MNEQICSAEPSNMGKFQYIPAQTSTCNPYISDFDNIDAASYTGLPGAMSMSGSIFSSGAICNPMMIAGGGMGMGLGYGYGDSSYFDNMKTYQQNWTNYYVDAQKYQRNSDLRINAPMEAIQETAANLKDKINHNEQGQIPLAYEKYLAAVRSAYGDGSEEELNSRALALYTQMNGGVSLVQDLRNNGHSSFLQGLIHTLSFGTYGGNSAEDNIANITHQEVPTGEKTEQNIGRLTGLGAIGTGTFALVKKFAKGAGKAVTKKAGIAGAIVAGTVGLITLLTSKVTT